METVNSVEDIYGSIGGFGRFQFFAICTILYPEFPGGMLEMLPIFTTNVPESWNCSRTDDDLEEEGLNVNIDYFPTCGCTGNRSGIEVDLVDLEESSIVSEWGLICQLAWVPDFITSIQMAGMLCGDIGGAYLNDKLGRKKAIYLYCLIMMLSSLVSAASPSIVLYGIAKFFMGAGISAYLILASVYNIEFLTPKWRSMTRGVGPWGEGVLVLVILAYFFRSWRVLTLVTSATCILFFPTYPFMLESPRWLIMKGNRKDAKKVFHKIARWNGRPQIPDLVLDNFLTKVLNTPDLETPLEVKGSHSDQGQGQAPPSSKPTLTSLFCGSPQTVGQTGIFMTLWFSSCLIYYGIGFNVKNLDGDPYRNALLMALVEMGGARTASFVTKCFGRRRALIGYMGIGALALIIIILLELKLTLTLGDPFFEVINVLTMVAKAGSAGSIAIIDVFTSESYPTQTRSKAVSLCNGAASIGSIISPQMALLGSVSKTMPYFIFGGSAILSTVLTLLLPETNGKDLPQ